MKSRTTKIPVTVLTGFLGSGKTTLVNRLLRERPHQKFGLVVNEFGEAALETQLVETRKRPIHELPSGCLCCVTDGDLKGALDALVSKDSSIDHILVEASGLSSPGPLLTVLTQDDSPYELSAVFGLIDVSTFLDREKEFSMVRRQVGFADALLLTKVDLAAPEARAQVHERLRTLAPNLRQWDTAEKLPWNALFYSEGSRTGDPERAKTEAKRRFFSGGQHHDATVFEYASDLPLNPVALGQVFENLDPAILRAKGFVYLQDNSARSFKYVVQFTGAQKQLYSRRWDKNEPRRSALIFLGMDFDHQALKSRLDGCQSKVTA